MQTQPRQSTKFFVRDTLGYAWASYATKESADQAAARLEGNGNGKMTVTEEIDPLAEYSGH